VRVIAGTLGGRKLRAPRGAATRPTSDRVREALFSVLGPLDGMRVLDLYAGSGALAIEALSRGAEWAVLVEKARDALMALRANLADLELEARSVVIASPVERSLGAVLEHGPFDVVFADPPYAQLRAGHVTLALESMLCEARCFGSDARLVLEHAARDQPPALRGAELGRTRRYGDTALSLYRSSA
jgi:16S rRNA (guanine(966)-N(2))-methyltransferase RsmD